MGSRRLTITWAMLMGLTAFAGIAAGVSGSERPTALALLALAAIIVAKCRLILANYLRLAQAPAILAGFTAAVAIVMTVVTLVFVVDLDLSRRPPTSRPSPANALAEPPSSVR